MPSFYHKQLELNSTRIILSREESQHAVKARRCRVGDTISVINGRGLSAICTLDSIDKSVATLTVSNTEYKHSPASMLIVASALPKGDRMRTMVDMLAQLGANRFIPLRCDHSVQRCSASVIEKLQRYALEASKQSDNPWLMQVEEEHGISDILAKSSDVSVVYADGKGQEFSQYLRLAESLCVAIGPEGGFSENELAEFQKAEVSAIRLSSTVLRTETAAVAVAAQWVARHSPSATI